jgi:hypothetical protein
LISAGSTDHRTLLDESLTTTPTAHVELLLASYKDALVTLTLLLTAFNRPLKLSIGPSHTAASCWASSVAQSLNFYMQLPTSPPS